MDIEQALQTFVEESRELLQQMEDALLFLETSEQDEGTVNAMFRAAHTIKGPPVCSDWMPWCPSPTWSKTCWTKYAAARSASPRSGGGVVALL